LLRRMLRRRLRCSFCGRTHDEVTRLVAGASAHICDRCIEKCVGVLEANGGWTRPAQP
jgi:ATP-dependent Clp protease ATP-binding subunit ClpX